MDETLQAEEAETQKAALRKVELGNTVSRQEEDRGPGAQRGKLCSSLGQEESSLAEGALRGEWLGKLQRI